MSKKTPEIVSSLKSFGKIAKWFVSPEVTNFTDRERNRLIAISPVLGGLTGAIIWAGSSTIKIASLGMDLASSFVSGQEITTTIPVVDTVVSRPLETVVFSAVAGIGVSSYYALAIRNNPPRDPDMWHQDIWNLPKDPS